MMDTPEEMAREWGLKAPQEWMKWEGWKEYVGCDNCASNGPDSPCWGEANCHWYWSGCGCVECAWAEPD